MNGMWHKRNDFVNIKTTVGTIINRPKKYNQKTTSFISSHLSFLCGRNEVLNPSVTAKPCHLPLTREANVQDRKLI